MSSPSSSHLLFYACGLLFDASLLEDVLHVVSACRQGSLIRRRPRVVFYGFEQPSTRQICVMRAIQLGKKGICRVHGSKWVTGHANASEICEVETRPARRVTSAGRVHFKVRRIRTRLGASPSPNPPSLLPSYHHHPLMHSDTTNATATSQHAEATSRACGSALLQHKDWNGIEA